MDTKGLFKKVVNLVTISSFLLWNLAAATPEGGTVVAGSASISQPNPQQTIINQSSQSAVINWSGFDTAAGDSVRFNQPNSSSIALNKINSGSPTNFNGNLSANGQVWIINPNGVLFGSSANINVAGLVATSNNINNANFMSGNYIFEAPSDLSASIINNGNITAADSGIVALVAPNVINNGLIQANLGKVALSTGAEFVLDMYGDSLINFGSSSPIQNGTVSNAGTIIANGGKVFMTANYAAGVLDNMINMSGAIQAKSVGTNSKGEIVLYGGNYQTKQVAGTTHVSGTLDTSDSTGGNHGGAIETSGYYVDFDPAAVINPGTGGSWLLDPNTIDIIAGGGISCTNPACVGFTPDPYISTGASTVSVGFVQNFLNNGVFLTLEASGDITISAPIVFTQASGTVANLAILSTGGDIIMNSTITSATSASAPPSTMTFTATAGSIIYNAQFIINNLANEAMDITFNAGTAVQINAPMLLPGIFGAGGTLHITAPLISINTPTIQLGGFSPSRLGFDFNGPVALQQSLAISANDGSDSVFRGAITAANSAISLSVTGNTQVNFGGDVGTVGVPLASLTLNTNSGMRLEEGGTQTIITNGDQVYNQNVFFFGPQIANFTENNPGNAVQFLAGINGNGGGQVNVNGNAVFQSASTNLSKLVVTGSTTFNGIASIDTRLNTTPFVVGVDQTYDGPIIVSSGADVTLKSTTNSNQLIHINGTVNGPGALTINAGINTVFTNIAGGVQLSSLTLVGPVTLDNAVLNAAIQTFESNVTVLAGGATLNAAGAVLFSGAAINGPGSLAVNDASGSVEFDGVVGGITPLSSLDVTGSQINIDTNGLSTSGDQTYSGPVFINNIGAIIFTGANIIFNSPVESSGTPAQITITGNLTIGNSSSIGAASDVSSLDVSGTTHDGGNITTTGDPTFGPYILTNDVTITDSSVGGITFTSTVDSDTFGPWNLILNATAGPVEFDGTVGAVNGLNNLTVTAPTINLNTGEIITQNNQTYNGSVILLQDMNSPGIETGFGFMPFTTLTFNGTVDGAFNLNVVAYDAEINGSIGSTTPLASLTLNSFIINVNNPTAVITTTGDQNLGVTSGTMTVNPAATFTGSNITVFPNVVLANDTIFTANGVGAGNGNISFTGTIDSLNSGTPANLTLNPNSAVGTGGTVAFDGNIGTNAVLASMTVNGTSLFEAEANFLVDTLGDQIYVDTVTIATNVSMLSTNPAALPVGTNVIQFCSVSGSACPTGTIGVIESSGPWALSAVTNNPNNGPMTDGGVGVTGSVQVGSLTLGGPGGARISTFAVPDTTVGGQGGSQARTNTIISPDFSSSGAVYCVNGFFCQSVSPIVSNNIPNNISQVQVFNLINNPDICDASGCNNLSVIMDNVAQAGIVNCLLGFAEIVNDWGQKRIALPGSMIYAGETVVADSGSQVCVKSIDGTVQCKIAP